MKKKEKAEKIRQILADLFPTPGIPLQHRDPFTLLVAVLLSAQCTDARVNIVTRDLFKKYTSVKDFAGASQEEFEQDIRSTGFYRNKAKNILATSHIIHEKYDDQVPKTMGELLELPGVARKTANVVLGYEFGVVEGVAVDTHVKRLSNLYGLTTEQNPIKIEQDLMKVLPKSEWVEYTMRMVEYGRKYCPASKHDHAHCPITMALTEAKLDPKSQQQ